MVTLEVVSLTITETKDKDPNSDLKVDSLPGFKPTPAIFTTSHDTVT